MILYCDTSALVKLYVREEGSDSVTTQAAAARVIAVSRVTWAEAMAAFSRRSREEPGDAVAIEEIRSALRRDWHQFALVEVTQSVVDLAAGYADTFALRGYDSVQLASARALQEAIEEPLCFACFDHRLNNAARVLGMTVLSPA